MWVLADSHDGYFCDFQVYTGKTIGAVEKDLGARVVKDLANNLKGKYHHTYFYNFFTGVNLLDEASQRRHLCLRNSLEGQERISCILEEAFTELKVCEGWNMGNMCGCGNSNDSVYAVTCQ